MEITYPIVLYIGIPVLLLIMVIRLKKKINYNSGKKIANTKYVEEDPYFKQVMRKYKILTYCIKGLCTIAILISLILLARPSIVDVSDSKLYNRDIFLCLDVSASVDELNVELVENLKKTVDDLKGERFGISIFNTSTVTLVPLTDDYEYVKEALDNIKKAITEANNLDYDYTEMDEHSYMLSYIQSGTLVGNVDRGSSLVGDGLASCIFSFPDIEKDKERTRIIILSTDNDVAGEELIELPEAAQLAKEKNITVFGIGPDIITNSDRKKLEDAVEKTGGSYYTSDDSTTVKEIVNNIEKKGKSLLEGKKQSRRIDQPTIPFIILLTSIMALFILSKKVKI